MLSFLSKNMAVFCHCDILSDVVGKMLYDAKSVIFVANFAGERLAMKVFAHSFGLSFYAALIRPLYCRSACYDPYIFP
jgi:hypothetical protein